MTSLFLMISVLVLLRAESVLFFYALWFFAAFSLLTDGDASSFLALTICIPALLIPVGFMAFGSLLDRQIDDYQHGQSLLLFQRYLPLLAVSTMGLSYSPIPFVAESLSKVTSPGEFELVDYTQLLSELIVSVLSVSLLVSVPFAGFFLISRFLVPVDPLVFRSFWQIVRVPFFLVFFGIVVGAIGLM